MEEGDSEKQHNTSSAGDTTAVPAERLPDTSPPEESGTSTRGPAPPLLHSLQADLESAKPDAEADYSETKGEKTVPAQGSQAEDISGETGQKPPEAAANILSETSLRPERDQSRINAPTAVAAPGPAEAGNESGSYEEEKRNENFQHQVPASNNDDASGEDAALGKQPSEVRSSARPAEMHQQVTGNELQDESAASPATERPVAGLASASALAAEAGRSPREAAADDPWVIAGDSQENVFDGKAADVLSETPPARWRASRTAASLLAVATEHATAAARQSLRVPLAGIPGSDDGDYQGFDRSTLAAEDLRKAPSTPPGKSTTEEASPAGYGGAPLRNADEDDAESLPAFADEENVALHKEITSKLKLLNQRGIELGQKADRVQLMQQHLQQLHAETAQLESLANAKEAHIHSDQHMDGVTLSQTGKLKSQVQQQQQHQQELQNRLTSLQLEIARGQEQIDCFKLRMKWNEDELAQWRSAANQNEEDLAFLAEYKKKDDARAAGLMLQIQKVSAEVTEAKKRLREEETAARAARAELQRSLEQFAEHQNDRAVLISQGETAMAEMWKSDDRIARSTRAFEKAQQALQKELGKLEGAKGFAARQQALNTELQGEISRLNQQLTNCRTNYANATTALGQLDEEVAALKGQLSAAATRGKTAKGQLVELHESLAVQQQRLESLNKKKETAKKRLNKEKENIRTAGEAREARETFYSQVSTRLRQLQQRVKATRDAFFGTAQKLAEEKEALKMKQGGLSSAKNALRSLQAQLRLQEAEKSRQQELLYAIDFQCQAMQRKVSRVSGYKSAAETKALQKQIKELQAESALQQEEQSMLSAQVKHLDGDIKKAQRSLAKADEEESRCATSVGDVRLACASLDRELQTVVKEKEALVLAESLRKLEVNRLHEELESCADASLEAENRKVQQQLNAQEALASIEAELDAARGQLRSVEEERHKLAKEAAERRTKIAGFEARYENLVHCGQGPDGVGHSQAYYLIRAGQEREELQRHGAALHRRLKSAAAEVEGLQATLRDVCLCNSRLRSKLQQQSKAVTVLREKKAEKQDALFLRNHMAFTVQQQIAALKDAITAEQRCLQEAKQVHHKVVDKLEVTEEQLRRLEKEFSSLDEKLQRALQQRQKLQTSLRQRRAAASEPAQPSEETRGDVCNAEMQCHAESLKVMLQSLYEAMGPLFSAEPTALDALQRALGEGPVASSLEPSLVSQMSPRQ